MMVVYCPSSSYQTDLPSHIYGLCILSEESITRSYGLSVLIAYVKHDPYYKYDG